MRIRLDGPTPRLDLTDPELMLTPEQAAAVAFRGEQVLTAGAGAGKTHTLSLRYTSLLLDLALQGVSDPSSVLVLTFTDKAAEEMAIRCHRRLLGLVRAAREVKARLDARDPRSGTALVDNLAAMADRFHRAKISTFHGFCASILREFPAASRTPPGARILKDAEARQLRRRALDEALHDMIELDRQGLPPLLDTFGSRAQLLDAGEVALERRGVLAPVLSAHRRGAVSIDDALAHTSISPAAAAEWAGGVGLPALHAIRRLVAPSGGGPFVRRTLLPLLETLAPPAPDDPPLEIFATYRRVLEALLMPTGQRRSLQHHSVMGSRRDWPGTRFGLARQAMAALETRLGDWADRATAAQELPTNADLALFSALTPFSAWIDRAATRLDRALDRDGRMTFDVLEHRGVRAVLEEGYVRQILRDRHRYIMVDEFQDTDEVQWSLVSALGRQSADVPEDRLFLIGDAKQAIYGFRGGDVTVFDRAAGQLAAAPAVLPDNFRSRPELIRWFNHLFPQILDPWFPARSGRTEAGGSVSLMRGSVADLGVGWQPRAVARLIAAEFVQPGSAWLDRQRYPVPPIAILLRTRTRQAAFEAELRRWSIPFVVAQGVGFWTRPEIIDVVNAVCAVVHGDAPSMVATLRGPWLALIDQDLQDLHEGGWGGGGLHRFGSAPLEPKTPLRIVRAWRQLRSWSLARRRLTPTALVSGIAAALAPARALADPSGQAEANVDRLLNLVADQGGDTAEVADWLIGEVESAPRESEAALQPAAARVVLGTVHGAKGLEFEVVVVPELDVRPRGVPAPLVVGRLAGRWRVAARAIDPTADLQTRVHPGLFTALQRVRRTEEDAEERRLLYVAATRAREHLILVGERSDPVVPGGRASWMQLVEDDLPPCTIHRSAGRVLTAPVPDRAVVRPAPPDPEVLAAMAPLSVPMRHTVRARGIAKFVACPARWYLDHRCGRGTGDPCDLDGSVRRCLVEVIGDGVAADPALVEVRWRAAMALHGATPAQADAARRDFDADLATAALDPDLAARLARPGHGSVSYRLDHGPITLVGTIDRVWLDEGGWVVLEHRRGVVQAADADPVLLAHGWAAERVLRGHTDVAVIRGEIHHTDVGRIEATGPWGPDDLDRVPRWLEAMAQTAGRAFGDVLAEATRDTQRPCDGCDFRGRGCPGDR